MTVLTLLLLANNIIPTCGLSNGTITANAGGGVNPLQYSLNGGAYQASNSFANVGAGNFTVTVKDANNCTISLPVAIVIDPPLVVNVNPTNTTCSANNGSLVIGAVGGDPAYLYSVNGGALQASGSFNNLSAGNYTAMVTDQDGCTSSVNVVIPDEPGPVITSTQSTEVTCYGGLDGSITVNVNGGTPVIHYSLNSGPFQSSNVFNNLYAGNYSITVQDANGCVATVNVVISQPDVVLAPYISVNSTCGLSNGSVTVNATGGIGTLTYSLNGGPFQSSKVFNNLSAGNYDITVMDGNGCLVVANTSVSNVPGPVIPVVNTNNVTCFGGSDGSLVINAIGGVPPLLYSIDNGVTYQATSNFSSLSAGNQTILVTDSNGCTVATNIVITEPTVITPVLNITGATCSNANGTVTLNANGGTGAFLYSFNGGPFLGITSFNSLAAGNYVYSIQDANNCSVNGNFNITDAPGPVITNAVSANTICNGSSNGTISVTATGGTNPKQYEIIGGQIRPNGNFFGLPAGNYNIIVTDANGCTATTSVTVNEPPALVINATPTGSNMWVGQWIHCCKWSWWNRNY